MKKIVFIVLAAGFLVSLFALRPSAEEEYLVGGIVVPPGMDVIKVGTANVLVPEGTQVFEKKGLITIETIGQYTARRLIEIEERFVAIETRVEVLEKAHETKEEPGKSSGSVEEE